MFPLGEYGWLIKGRAALETDDNRFGSSLHRLVLIKMITGLGLGELYHPLMHAPRTHMQVHITGYFYTA